MRVEQICRDVDHVPDETTLHQLNNIVMMGSGEPLANYQHVMAAIRILNAPWGLHIGARKITISTVGLPKQIRKLADEGLQVNLALSAHAPNDQLRRELIPWAEQIGLAELVAACRHYFEKTGREITFEYILLAGVNDRAEHAEQLAKLVKQLRCNVNLIRYNPVSPLPFGRPTSDATTRFQAILRKSGVNAHVRKSRGMDIDAACGQLRRRAQADALVTLSTPGARGAPATE
jgi:23S rRNA (adenine2503-C2)-methyltransferase